MTFGCYRQLAMDTPATFFYLLMSVTVILEMADVTVVNRICQFTIITVLSLFFFLGSILCRQFM